MYTGTQWFSDMMNASALFPGGWFVLNISTVRVMGMIRPIQHWNHSVFRLLTILSSILSLVSFFYSFSLTKSERSILFSVATTNHQELRSLLMLRFNITKCVKHLSTSSSFRYSILACTMFYHQRWLTYMSKPYFCISLSAICVLSLKGSI